MPNNAILFNGAASLIAQEAGILDLLLGNVDGVPGVGLNIQPDDTFVGGLSSGALMTFVLNAAFSQNPVLTWDQFKNEVLFTMTTDKVYTGAQAIFNTEPLRDLLQGLTSQVNLKLIEDLPFDSAILATNTYLSATGATLYKIYWLTNIEEVAKVLPSETMTIAKNIKDHQSDLTLVSALMCSTAIPFIFPPRKLYYPGMSIDLTKYVSIRNKLNGAANFIDGGFGGTLVFSGYKEFFEAYGQTFDNIYFISPNYTKIVEEALQKISSMRSSGATEEEENDEDPLLFMDNLTKAFIKDIKAYNSNSHLANKIYYCKPEIGGFKALDFSTQREQYNATIAWGKSNPDKIAIDISTIPDSELEPTPIES